MCVELKHEIKLRDVCSLHVHPLQPLRPCALPMLMRIAPTLELKLAEHFFYRLCQRVCLHVGALCIVLYAKQGMSFSFVVSRSCLLGLQHDCVSAIKGAYY